MFFFLYGRMELLELSAKTSAKRNFSNRNPLSYLAIPVYR